MTDVAITYLTPERFEIDPQIGVSVQQEWASLVRWLAWPTFANDKRAAGAWTPTALPGGAVKDGRGPVSLLVADVDTCVEGALEHSAAVLKTYAGLVVPTFNATVEQPKHRIVLLLSRPLEPNEFPIGWGKMARELAAAGIALDRTCRNINRLWFGCVARSPATWLGARILTGDPVPVDAMLEAARAEEEEERARRPQSPATPIKHPDRYVRAAIRNARVHLAQASEGERHDTLLREAYALARFGMSASQIADALLETFVGAAGEARRREGERAIRDAVRARGAA